MKDFHVHSGFVKHTKSDLKAVVQTLERLNFSEVLIVEHFTYPVALGSRLVRDEDKIETLYIEREDIPVHVKNISLGDYIEELNNEQKNTSIKILKGLEVDYFHECEEDIAALLSKYDFDILLGSCHFIKEGGQYSHLGLNATLKETLRSKVEKSSYYEDFFNSTYKMVASKLFNFVAHIDFIKKMIPPEEYNADLSKRLMLPILKLMVENEVGLEINLKGLEDVSSPYPAEDIIEIYKGFGGRKISIGSDSHSVNGLKRASFQVKKYGEKYGL